MISRRFGCTGEVWRSLGPGSRATAGSKQAEGRCARRRLSDASLAARRARTAHTSHAASDAA